VPISAAPAPPAEHVYSSRRAERWTKRVRKREKGFYSRNQLPLYFELLKGIVIDVLPTDKALLLFTSQTTAASVSWFVSSLEEE
jgi:hypothetical protein